MNAVTEKTFFEQMGGMSAVDAAVDIFYTKVLADERISHFFRWTNMQNLQGRQKVFLAHFFGAAVPYSGKSMRNAHAHLVERGLNASHFDAMMEHLLATLQELGITEDLIMRAKKITEIHRQEVLGH